MFAHNISHWDESGPFRPGMWSQVLGVAYHYMLNKLVIKFHKKKKNCCKNSLQLVLVLSSMSKL